MEVNTAATGGSIVESLGYLPGIEPRHKHPGAVSGGPRYHMATMGFYRKDHRVRRRGQVHAEVGICRNQHERWSFLGQKPSPRTRAGDKHHAVH